jgi:hypothetical protein
MGRMLRSLLIASSAAVIAVGFGSSTAPASEAPCGPADVVPNPVPQPSWKGGPVTVIHCGQPVVAEPAVLPRERVDTPPNVGAAPQRPLTAPATKAKAAKKAKAKKAKAKKAKARKAKLKRASRR